jgi:hypothetical protein
MIKVPENALKIGESMCAFIDEYKGNDYLNIRKMYQDRDSGELALGKGLTIKLEDFDYIVEAIPEIEELVENHIRK